MRLEISDAFGFHTRDQLMVKYKGVAAICGKEMSEPAEKTFPVFAWIKNLSMVACYLPGIGTIVGIAKLVFLAKAESFLDEVNKEDPKAGKFKSETRDFFLALKIRSWVEAASLGFLCVLPDLIFTIGRNLAPYLNKESP